MRTLQRWIETAFETFLFNARLIVILAVLGSLTGSFLMFVKGAIAIFHTAVEFVKHPMAHSGHGDGGEDLSVSLISSVDAFLFAKVTGWEALNLLPGPMHIYFEGTYVGESELDLSAAGDTLDLSLGRDKGVAVQRTKRKDFSQKQTVGSKRTDSISWELAVRNNKAQAVQLIVTDQFPVAARSEIEVELVESSAARVDKAKGFLSWKKTIEPRTNAQWVFTYSVKYPKEGVVWLE